MMISFGMTLNGRYDHHSDYLLCVMLLQYSYICTRSIPPPLVVVWRQIQSVLVFALKVTVKLSEPVYI
jgi:hypothetical protein